MESNSPTSLESETLHRLLDVSRRLGITADLDEILGVIIDTMRDLLNAERATVFEYDKDKNQLFATVAHGLTDSTSDAEEVRFPADQGIAGEAAACRKIVNVKDAYKDLRFNQEIDKQTGFHTRSILSIPLLSFGDELVGVAQVLNKHSGTFNDSDKELAEALGAQAAVAIKRARLVADQIAKSKMERDLELAREIQQETFPKSLPKISGYEIAAWSEPADSTGGDAYDIVPLELNNNNSSRTLFLLADAAGHGVGPSLLATSIRAMLRMATRLDADFSAMCQHLNTQLCEDTPGGHFITAWLGILDSSRNMLTSFSAGQAPLFHLKNNTSKADQLNSDVMPFGIMSPLDSDKPLEISMEAGDMFIIASDGIYEAMDKDNNQFGADRLLEAIRNAQNMSAHDISQHVKQSIEYFTGDIPPSDDRTLIIIKRP